MISTQLAKTGLGLRSLHIEKIIAESPAVAWFEILYENYQVPGGRAPKDLELIASGYKTAFHCVGLDVGSTDPLDTGYLSRLKNDIVRYRPELVSCHLCFTVSGGNYLHDLLPLPFTDETIAHVVERISKVQEFLEQEILVENISSYIRCKDDQYTEAEFISAVVQKTGCGILLDVNNAYVNQRNHNEDALAFMGALPKNSVQQMHLAGFEERDTLLVDTHGNKVSSEVWDLFGEALRIFGDIPACIERDNNIPPLAELIAEATYADGIRSNIFASQPNP